MTDAIAEFLKRGGKIKSCPTAATAEGTAVVPEADRKRLAEHLDERKEKAAFRWGHQKEQPVLNADRDRHVFRLPAPSSPSECDGGPSSAIAARLAVVSNVWAGIIKPLAR